MKIKDSEFWTQLKKLVDADNHVEVPNSSVETACSIFQTANQENSLVNMFSLRPAFTGTVRRGGKSSKLFYELDDEHIVQLENNQADEGFNLSGFTLGFEETPVVLYGQESVFESQIEEGGFEFNSLAPGQYSLSFSQEGEEYWINDLELGAG